MQRRDRAGSDSKFAVVFLPWGRLEELAESLRLRWRSFDWMMNRWWGGEKKNWRPRPAKQRDRFGEDERENARKGWGTSLNHDIFSLARCPLSCVCVINVLKCLWSFLQVFVWNQITTLQVQVTLVSTARLLEILSSLRFFFLFRIIEFPIKHPIK